MTCWNCSGACSSFVYLKRLLQTTDVLALSEHWLYDDSLSFLDTLDFNFECFAKSSNLNDLNTRWRRGQGGVAILWRKIVLCQIFTFKSDRVIGIKLKGDFGLVICSVYFPSSNRSLSEFKETLQQLEQFCYQQKVNGEYVVMMGDFNAHLTVLRSNQTMNARGRLLQGMVSRLKLCALHTSELCTGPINTYVSTCGTSVVDYIIVDNCLKPLVRQIEVVNEEPDNTAFHLPIAATIKVDNSWGENLSSNVPDKRIAWSKCTSDNIAMYCETLLELLPPCNGVLLDTPTKIDDQVLRLGQTMIAADRSLPGSVYNNKIKPYWSKKLNRFKKISREKFRYWKAEGRPRGLQYPSYVEYKRAKSTYRREQRNLAQRSEQDEFDEISRASEIDNVRFWRYINRKRSKGRKKSMTLEIDGKTISNPKELSSLWAKYYESLFTPSGAFNEAFKDHIDSEVERLVACDVPYDFILDDPVTVEEIRCVLTKLPSGKAPGHDGIFYEHIKLAGDIMVTYLVQLFNSIIKREYIPWSFKLGVKIPIPKGRKTGVYTFDDYRGISLLTSFNKIMERLVLLRIQKKPKCTLHNLQGAYRSEQDALTTAFITDETIKHCCEEKDKVYVCYIDITKAFDKLWINGMLYKLFQSVGISGKCLRIIKLWYTGMREMVCIDGNYSKCYNILQGTRQGGVLSPWLFTVFVNDLISILQRTGLGIVIHDMYYGSPMFADDLTMLSRLKSGLDQMLKSLHDYSLLWRITFNQKKTVVMVWGEKKPDKHNLGNSSVVSW